MNIPTQVRRGRRQTVSGPSKSLPTESSVTYHTLEDFRRPAKDFEKLMMEETEQFLDKMGDEPLSVRSYSPDFRSFSNQSSTSTLPNIRERSKSMSTVLQEEQELLQNGKIFPYSSSIGWSTGSRANRTNTMTSSSSSSSIDPQETSIGSFSKRRSSAVSSTSASSSSESSFNIERMSATTGRLLQRQRRFSEITTPTQNLALLARCSGKEQLYKNSSLSYNMDTMHNPVRRESLPPLKLSMSQSQSGSNLAGKYYKRWREKKSRKTKGGDSSNSSKASSKSSVIEEERISLQKHVTFSPEFEKVFNDLYVNDDDTDIII